MHTPNATRKMPVTRTASAESPASNTRSRGPAKSLVDAVLDSPVRSRIGEAKRSLNGQAQAKGQIEVYVGDVEGSEGGLNEGEAKAQEERGEQQEATASVPGLNVGEGELGTSQLGEASASGSSSEDESEVESDDDSDGSEESDTSADDDEDLQALLAKARLAAQAKQTATNEPEAPADDENVFGELGKFENSTKKPEAPLPGLALPTLPPSLLHLNADGSAGLDREQTRPKLNKGKGRAIPELDTAIHERPLSRRQKEAMPKKQTASDEWAAMPRVAEEVLPQMKRDYQALVLANSLDPKRFMRGGNRAGKIPEKFAIGTIINPPRHLQTTTIERTATYRPGQIVNDLVGDQAAGDYAKRKYGDLQSSRQRNGRGQGWKSKKPKWK